MNFLSHLSAKVQDIADRYSPFIKRSRLRMRDLPFDLQLFAGEKTEPATDKRREEARERGQVAKSQDAEATAVLFTALVCLYYFGPQMFGVITDFMRYCLTFAAGTVLQPGTTTIVLHQFLWVFVKTMSPIFIVVAFTAIAANLAQVGFLFSTEPLIPDLNRINPINGLENLISWKSVAELVKSIFKIAAVAYIPYSTLHDQMPFILRFIQLDPFPAMRFLLEITFWMAMKILLLLALLAIADYFFQWWRLEESLKMSKEEIKEEYKQREGDPKVKAKIREKQRRMAQARMMQEVPKATVVVTNPTHLAVAIFYDRDNSTSAPRVVAKGAGLIAQKIKEIAKEHDVPTIENKPLARALHDKVEVGEEIPVELWETVALVLAEVYRMKGMV